jgi:hypothetical protein
VAVVWSVAVSFVAFELVFLRGADFLMSRPALSGSLVLSAATRSSQTCVVPADHVATGGDAVSPTEARVGAWLLGLKIGRDAIARQYASVDRNLLAQGLQDAQRIAGMLGTPAPAIFVPQHAATANTDFIAFVEADASQTARQLALRHSAESCLLYKLGTFWGYAALVRPSLPGERALFAAEIRHYAMLAGLPLETWAPLSEVTPVKASPSEINAQSADLTQKIGAYLAARR